MPVIYHAEACRAMILSIGVSFQTYFIAPCARDFFGRVCWTWVPLSRSLASFLALALSPPPACSPLALRWAHAPLLSLQLVAGAALPPRPRGLAQSAAAPCGRLPPSPLGPATLRGMAAAAASPPAAVAATATATADAIVPRC